MPKQYAVVAALMLLFAGAGSSTLLTGALAQAAPLTAVQQEKRLGPKPTPHWYWRWTEWKLGEGYAKGHRLERAIRPHSAPSRIPGWAWQRLHYFLLARTERALAGQGSQPGQKKHKPPTTSTGTTTSTTPTTTTSPTTTTTSSSGGSETYDQAISYTQAPPAFTPTRMIDVSSAAELQAAISNLQAGDLVQATGAFTVSGETVIRNRLSAPAVLDLTGVSFVYKGGSNLPAVWLNNAQHLYIYGGDLSTADTGGTCLLDYGSQHVLWWGFTVHDCGGSGFAALTVGGSVDDDDFQGEIWKVGQNLAWDPHAEKGTGEHAALLWDANSAYAFTNNRFAFYAHDIPVGACVELGNPVAAPATGNVLYEKCVDETEVASTQTGGNGLQFWGNTTLLGLRVKYLEVDDAQGRALDAEGLYSGQSLAGVTVEYGRGSNTNLNHALNEPNPSMPWDWRGSVVYQDVQAAS